jgi:signal transduction histidine kinase
MLETVEVPLRPRRLSKSTLTELSHVLENTVIAHDLPGAVFTGFQRSRHWYRELERYQRLVAPRARSVAVFAAGNLDTMAEDDIVRVPLAEDDPLVEEWFLVVLTPAFTAVLVGEETGEVRDEDAGEELDRVFDTVWSLEPATVGAITAFLQAEVARIDPLMGERMTEALVAYPPIPADDWVREEATHELVAALETGRERHRKLAARERRAADELRAIDRSKSAFLTAVSHELRTPLTVVDGTAQTLHRLGTALSADERIHLEAALATQTARLSALLEDLLDLDRLTRGSVASQRVDLDAVEVARTALEAVPGADRVVLDAPLHLPARLDRTQLGRIIANLVSNAVKYAPDGPIEVTLSATDTGLRIVVDDHGPGIPRAQRERVLQPFHRLAHDHPQPGTGVGLALVAEFVRLQGGQLRIADRPGGGARFEVRLPTGE